MARIRYIKPEFFDSEQVAGVSLAARLLFAGLWTVADREGRFELAPRRLKARLFPYDSFEIEPLLGELVRADLMKAYVVNGTAYGWMTGFVKHQRPHPNEAKSVIPAYTPEADDAGSWNVTSRNDASPQPPLPSDSLHVTSRNDACTQSRGEGNGDGEGTEREGTARTLTGGGQPVEVTVQTVPRRRGYDDPHGQRLDPNAAGHAIVSERQKISIPASWWEGARADRGLAFDDVDVFAKWLATEVRGGLAIGKHKLSWLDEQLARWDAARRRPNDGLRPASEFIEQHRQATANLPKLTADERRALLRPGRPSEAPRG